MPNYESVHIEGHLTREPVIRETTNSRIATIDCATNRTMYNGDKRTTYHRLKAWGGLADEIEGAQVGDAVIFRGHLEYGKYEKNGVTHYTTDLVAESLSWKAKKTAAAVPDEKPDVDPVPF